MRVLLIGDSHLKINRFDLVLNFLSWLNQLIKEQKPDIVVNLGDTFDTHSVLRSEIVNEFMKHVYSTIDQGIPYIYLCGNHDQYKPTDSKYHAMLPFKDKIPNLYVVDQTCDLFDMTFVPFQAKTINFPRKTLPICIAHQTFIGANYGPINAQEGVDPQSIADVEVIISGHIHIKSVLGDKVRYVGSPFSQCAADVDHVKGITIFDTSTYRETFHENPLPKWRRVRSTISPTNTIANIHDVIESSVTGSKDHWVLEFEGPKAEIVGYLGSKQYQDIIKHIDVKVKTEFTDKEKKKIAIEAKSMDHIISEFVLKVYNGSIDKKELVTKAQTILNEVRLNK